MAENVLPPLFRTAVQAELPARRSKGRFGIALAARRLENAERRVVSSLAETNRRVIRAPKNPTGDDPNEIQDQEKIDTLLHKRQRRRYNTIHFHQQMLNIIMNLRD